MALFNTNIGGAAGGALETGTFETAVGVKHISFANPHENPVIVGVHVGSNTFSFTNACSVLVDGTQYNVDYTPSETVRIFNITNEGFDTQWNAVQPGSFFVK